MAAGQPLRGFVGQGMDGRRARSSVYAYSYPPGSYTWTCPAAGPYKLVLWGGGGGSDAGGNLGGGSGALYIAERFFGIGQQVALVVGTGGITGGNGSSSTATLPGGEVITAGAGQVSGAGGTVTANRNIDVTYAGSAGGAAAGAGAAGLGDAGGAGGAAAGGNSGGAGAPGYGTYRGGDGQAANQSRGAEGPASGKGVNSAVGDPGSGGDGLILIVTARV